MPHILKIGADGSTTVIAGNGPDGFSGDDGPATLAVLNTPQGVAVDGAGNIYVADYGNHRMRKIDTSGNINTIAGNGKAQFSGDNGPAMSAGMDPFDLALDSAGDILVVDQFEQSHPHDRAEQYDHHGGGNGRCRATRAMAARRRRLCFSIPTGIALDRSGNMYIADEGNSVVRRVTNGRVDHNHRG